MCEIVDLENIVINVGGIVINLFLGEVVDVFLWKIFLFLLCYFGFFEFSEEMFRIVVKIFVCFGKFWFVWFIKIVFNLVFKVFKLWFCFCVVLFNDCFRELCYFN